MLSKAELEFLNGRPVSGPYARYLRFRIRKKIEVLKKRDLPALLQAGVIENDDVRVIENDNAIRAPELRSSCGRSSVELKTRNLVALWPVEPVG